MHTRCKCLQCVHWQISDNKSMDKFIHFLKIISWVGAIISSVLWALSAYFNFEYHGSIEELRDKAQGIKRTYPTTLWFIIALVCWAFIIAF